MEMGKLRTHQAEKGAHAAAESKGKLLLSNAAAAASGAE